MGHRCYNDRPTKAKLLNSVAGWLQNVLVSRSSIVLYTIIQQTQQLSYEGRALLATSSTNILQFAFIIFIYMYLI